MSSDSIFEWVQQLYSSFLCSEEEQDALLHELPQEDVLIAVAGFIIQWPSSVPPAFEDIYDHLRNLYSVPEGLTLQSEEFLEFLLFHAVSEHCEKRMECVQTMMQMEEETQVSLMQIIQSYLERKDELVKDGMAAEDAESSNANTEPAPVATNNFSYDQDSSCGQCHSLLKEIEHVKAEISLQEQNYHKEVNDCKQRLMQAQNKLEDNELQLLQKNQEVHALQASITEYTAKLSEMESKLSVLAQSQMSSMAVQDELEVLRPLAAQAQAYETQVTKLKEKLEDLASIKQQYVKETESHQVTYSKLLELEKQVEELIENKKLVEKYRNELAEIYVVNQEYMQKASQYQAELEQVKSQNSSLQSEQDKYRKEQQVLSHQLDAFSEEARSNTHYNSISEGLSEFNPVLMQELMSLRKERAELLSKLDHSSMESLQKLEKENADVKCIYNNVQSKYLQTKDQLTAAEKKIASLQEQLYALDMSKKEVMRKYQEIVSMYSEEVDMLKHVGQVNKLLAAKHLTAQVELVQLANGAKRKLETEEHEEDVKRLKVTHESELAQLTSQFTEEVAAMQDSHAQALAAEQQQVVTIQGMLDDEVSKRRRMERMKRLLDVELQRLKVQVSANGAGASAGFDEGAMGSEMATAAKEMKSMQETIDSQQKEIQQLKQQLASMQYSGHSAAAGSQGAQSNNSSGQTSALHSKALRVSSAPANGGTSIGSGNFLEQMEFHDKRLEQLAKEKREILSKSLEDNKEKLELSQKLVVMEKENSNLKGELRKVRLEKERLERKMWKEGKIDALTEDKENVGNVAY